MKALTLLAAATAASAHTIFVQLEADGTRYPVSHGVRTPQYDGPITDVSSNDLACNGGPNPTMKTDKIITVTAGSTVKAIWRHTLQSGPNDVMDPSHKGPTLAYLKKVDNALTDSGVGGGWFKIQEDGHSNGDWGTLKVINNQGIHYIDIPDCIESGQYLLRAEMIALHAAGSPGGAQLYMECAQIEIVGGKGTVKPQTYSIPGIYKSNDPGILINIYSMSPSSQYIIPGPPLFTCNGGGSNNGGGNNGGSNPPVQQPPATTLTTAIAQPTPICSVQQWGQCGGQGYSGCTTCASPYRCNEINAWYSQCL